MFLSFLRTPRSTPRDSPAHRSGSATPVEAAEPEPEVDPVLEHLQSSLLTYCSSTVQVPQADLDEAVTVVEDIKKQFLSCLSTMVPNHQIRQLEFAHSMAEGSYAVQAVDFDILVMLTLDPDSWQVIDAGLSLLAAHGYRIVKRVNLDYFSRGATVYDKYLVSDYLSPSKINKELMDLTNRINWGTKYKIRPAVVGGEAKLDVFYGKEAKKHLEINLTPAIELNSVLVIAKAHPQSDTQSSFDNLWQECHLVEETRKLTTPSDGCQLTCLKVLKAVAFYHSEQLGVLPGSVLKNAVLLTMDQDDDKEWSEESLAERFADVITTLGNFLRAGVMPHFRNPHLDLLSTVAPLDVQTSADFLAAIIEDRTFVSLLTSPFALPAT